uniref:Uncharacterized protein n=1 Tax=Anopheles minimus TaxID=112268 RepID=A0A182W6V7_9DIPT
MGSIGKVKSEYTISGRRADTPATLKTPANTRIPKSASSTSPQTAIERKLVAPEWKRKLTRSNPSPNVKNIIYHDASDKANDFTCEEISHPNCSFVNICNEPSLGGSRWEKYVWTLWTYTGRIAQLLVASLLVFVWHNVVLTGIFWMLDGRYREADSEGTHETDDCMLQDEAENEAEELDRHLQVLNPKGFSLAETTHTLTLVDMLIIALERLFGWIGNVLLPRVE